MTTYILFLRTMKVHIPIDGISVKFIHDDGIYYSHILHPYYINKGVIRRVEGHKNNTT